jgi:nitrate reductase NapE component
MTVMNKELDKAKQEGQQQKEIITTKLVITMVIIAIVKIAVLVLWI